MSGNDDGLRVQIAHHVHPALDLDIQLNLGREVGILFGPSGAGKTTILRLIAGLVRPDRGSISVAGDCLFDSTNSIETPLRKRRIGLIFQDDLLFPHLSVERNVRFGLDRWPRSEANARLTQIASLCGISRLLDRDPATLSGGERQRVGLARAMAPQPRLLLCDEPFSALDLDARDALVVGLKGVQLAESIPILYVTHSPDEAVALGDRLFLLAGGRIIADGDPLETLASRAEAGSIRLVNHFDATIDRNGVNDPETILKIMDGPLLVVPKRDDPIGNLVRVAVDAAEIVLTHGPIGAISARNMIEGTVAHVVSHGHEAEILVKTGGVTWVVGVVASTVESLGLNLGAEVRMIVKSRSCRVVRLDSNR